MIIQCDKCSTKFRIDDSKVKGAGVKVRCTKCQNVFIAIPPAPPQEAPLENTETTRSSAPNSPEENKDAGFGLERQGQAQDSSGGLDTDTGGAGFLRDSANEGAEAEKSAGDYAGSGRFNVDTSGSFDLSGDTDMGAQKQDEQESTAGSLQMSVGGEFNFDGMASGSSAAEQNNMSEETPEEDKKAGGWKLPTEEKTEEAPQAPAAPKREAVVSVTAPKPEKAPAPPMVKKEIEKTAAKETGGFDASAFDKTADELESLVRNLPGEEAPSGQGVGEDDEETGSKGAVKGNGNGLAVGIIIIVALLIIGGAAYFAGVFSPSQTHLAQKTIDITGITGTFVDNKNAGRLLVLQAQIINVTGLPQTVRGVRGIVYGPKNEKLSTIVVSAGRTLGAEDLKNMSQEDILKAFKDLSSSVIPSKGSAPVMIVFTTVPQGMAEFGIDIIR